MTVELNLDDVEAPTEPSVVFTLDGREWVCKNRAAIPAVIVDGLLGGVPMRLDVLWRGLLVDQVERDGKMVDQADEFVAMMARPDSPFDLDRWEKLSRTLTEAVLNRPTRPSAPSQRGRLTTAGTSKAGSSSQGTGRKKRAG